MINIPLLEIGVYSEDGEPTAQATILSEDIVREQPTSPSAYFPVINPFVDKLDVNSRVQDGSLPLRIVNDEPSKFKVYRSTVRMANIRFEGKIKLVNTIRNFAFCHFLQLPLVLLRFTWPQYDYYRLLLQAVWTAIFLA